jgi:hypothetical protein
VFITVADAAQHDISPVVLRILPTTMAFSARAETVAFTLALHVGNGIILDQDLAGSFSSLFALSTTAFHQLDDAANASNWFSGEASPSSFRLPVVPVDSLSGFLFGHMGHVWQMGVFGSIIR